MKKTIITILILCITLSCSKDDDQKDSTNPSNLTPEIYSAGHLTPLYGSYEALEDNEKFEGHGKFQLMLHDALPEGNIEAINLDIMEIRIVPENGQILTVSDTPMVFNLLDFTETNPIEMVNTRVPTGRYCQIRLMFAEDQTILIDGEEKPLKTPSAATWQSGFKLISEECFEIVEGQLFSMTVDFDPNKSIVYNPGKDRYILKPVVKIVGTSTTSINVYNMETRYGGETLVVQFRTDGNIQFISSEDGRYVFTGHYVYNALTRGISITYEEVLVIDPDCLDCGILGSISPEEFNMNSKYTSFEVMDYTDSTLQLKMVETGEVLDFTSRRTYGPFEDF